MNPNNINPPPINTIQANISHNQAFSDQYQGTDSKEVDQSTNTIFDLSPKSSSITQIFSQSSSTCKYYLIIGSSSSIQKILKKEGLILPQSILLSIPIEFSKLYVPDNWVLDSNCTHLLRVGQLLVIHSLSILHDQHFDVIEAIKNELGQDEGVVIRISDIKRVFFQSHHLETPMHQSSYIFKIEIKQTQRMIEILPTSLNFFFDFMDVIKEFDLPVRFLFLKEVKNTENCRKGMITSQTGAREIDIYENINPLVHNDLNDSIQMSSAHTYQLSSVKQKQSNNFQKSQIFSNDEEEYKAQFKVFNDQKYINESHRSIDNTLYQINQEASIVNSNSPPQYSPIQKVSRKRSHIKSMPVLPLAQGSNDPDLPQQEVNAQIFREEQSSNGQKIISNSNRETVMSELKSPPPNVSYYIQNLAGLFLQSQEATTLQALQEGVNVWKYGRGKILKVKTRRIRFKNDLNSFYMTKLNQNDLVRLINTRELKEIKAAQQTDNFQRYKSSIQSIVKNCFSLCLSNGRTIDLEFMDSLESKNSLFLEGVKDLIALLGKR